MEDDWEYRQAIADEGHDPDDPVVRAAIADTVALLRRIGSGQSSYAFASRDTPRREGSRYVRHPSPNILRRVRPTS